MRQEEQRKAAAVVGVSGLPLRRSIASAIRRARPQIVITDNYHETAGPGFRNLADHMVTGRAVIDAVRDAANRWVFRELVDEGLEPWSGVQAVFVANSPFGARGVDVTDTFATGMAALKAHAPYFAGLAGPQSVPEQQLDAFARLTGSRLGVSYASLFEVVPVRV